MIGAFFPGRVHSRRLILPRIYTFRFMGYDRNSRHELVGSRSRDFATSTLVPLSRCLVDLSYHSLTCTRSFVPSLSLSFSLSITFYTYRETRNPACASESFNYFKLIIPYRRQIFRLSTMLDVLNVSCTRLATTRNCLLCVDPPRGKSLTGSLAISIFLALKSRLALVVVVAA